MLTKGLILESTSCHFVLPQDLHTVLSVVGFGYCVVLGKRKKTGRRNGLLSSKNLVNREEGSGILKSPQCMLNHLILYFIWCDLTLNLF